MGNTPEGGKKASITTRKRHGEDFYKKIGRKGGLKGHTGGFYTNRELASTAGRKGGLVSVRVRREKRNAR